MKYIMREEEKLPKEDQKGNCHGCTELSYN